MYLRDEKGNQSSNRLGFVLIIIASVVALFATLGLAFFSVITTGETPNWSGMGAFLAGLSAFAGVAFGGKVWQKKEEIKGGKK